MPRSKAEALLEQRRTKLGRAIMANEEFCRALLNMRHQVDVWDAMETGPKMDKVLDKHGIDLHAVKQRAFAKWAKKEGWIQDADGDWRPPEGK